MKGTYLGCEFSNKEIISYLNKINATFEELKDEELFQKIAQLLDEGKVIGWFNGAMEFGPRALGGRSIIGDPRNSNMQSVMNLKIKYRESFRPFAPSVIEEDVANQFEMNSKSPYMLLVAPVKTSFNVRGEPIVCTPEDAYRCFIRTNMDVLVLQNQILMKKKQIKTEIDESWKEEFELD